jgi:hypothetical protein
MVFVPLLRIDDSGGKHHMADQLSVDPDGLGAFADRMDQARFAFDTSNAYVGSMGSEAGLAEVCDALADFDQRFASFGGGPLAAVGTGPHDDSTVAKQYAKDLNAALADPTAPWAQSLLTATSEDLSNADSATLQAFFAPPNNGAQLLANLSVALAPPSDREPYGTAPRRRTRSS